MDQAITRIAERQHGVVGRRQLLAAEFPRTHIDALVRRGHLSRISRGVYRVAGCPLTVQGEALAATIRCGPDAVVVGERMLALLGVHTARRDGPFTVLTRPGRDVTGIDWSWRHNPCDTDADLATIDGIASVTFGRNLVEAAVDASRLALERLVDGCRWLDRLHTAVGLANRMPRHPGARRLLDSGLVDAGAPESRPERRVAGVLAGLGAETQVDLTEQIRVDFFFRRAGLVLEYDGKATHEGPAARDRDDTRDEVLRALGLAVEHIRARDLDDPAGLRSRVLGLLTALGDRDHACR